MSSTKEDKMKNYKKPFFDYKDLWPVWIDKNFQYENQEVEFLENRDFWIFYGNE